MTMFVALIAFMLSFLALAAGLVALHYWRQSKAPLMRAAAILLIVFGAISLLCTSYYAVKHFIMEDEQKTVDFNIQMDDKGLHYHFGEKEGK